MAARVTQLGVEVLRSTAGGVAYSVSGSTIVTISPAPSSHAWHYSSATTSVPA